MEILLILLCCCSQVNLVKVMQQGQLEINNNETTNLFLTEMSGRPTSRHKVTSDKSDLFELFKVSQTDNLTLLDEQCPLSC